MRGTQDCATGPRNLAWGCRALQFRLSRYAGSFRSLVSASLIVSPQKKCVRALFLSAMFFPLKKTSFAEGFLMCGTQDCAIKPRNLAWGCRALQFRLSRYAGSFRSLVSASLIVSPQKKCVRALFLSAMFFPLKNPPLRRVF